MKSPSARIRNVLSGVALAIATTGAQAQVVERLPVSFLNGNTSVEASAVLENGGIVVGGQFDAVHGEVRDGIARLEPNGSIDAAFDAECRALARPTESSRCEVTSIIAAQGALYVAGRFRGFGEATRHGLAKLDAATGAVDPQWSPLGPVAPGTQRDVVSVALVDDGVLVVVEERVGANPPTSTLRKFQRDGVGAAAPGFSVSAVPSGAVVTAGAGGEAFVSGAEFDVYKIDATTGQLIGGWISGVRGVQPVYDAATDALFVASIWGSGTTPNGVMKLRRTVSPPPDFAFRPNVAPVQRMRPGPEGSLLVVLGPYGSQRYVRVSASGSGSVLAEFPAPENDALPIAVDPQGRILVARKANQSGDWVTDGSGLGRLLDDGTVDSAFRSGVFRFAQIRDVAEAPDGSIVVGGDFTRVDGVRLQNLARLEPDLTLDADWTPPWSSAPVNAVAVDAAGDVYAGSTERFHGQLPTRLAKFSGIDGALVQAWNPGGIVGEGGGSIERLVVDDSAGVLYVAGSFTTNLCDSDRAHLARVTLGGRCVVDAAWTPQTNGPVEQLALGGDGQVYISGDFTSVQGLSARGLARLSRDGGVPDPTWLWSPSPAAHVEALMPTTSGVFVGGSFSSVGDQPSGGLARLSSRDATLDPSWAPQPALATHALARDGDALYVARAFDGANPDASGIDRIDILGPGGVDPGFTRVDAERRVNGIRTLRSGVTLIFGEFLELGGVATGTIATLGDASRASVFGDGFE